MSFVQLQIMSPCLLFSPMTSLCYTTSSLRSFPGNSFFVAGPLLLSSLLPLLPSSSSSSSSFHTHTSMGVQRRRTLSACWSRMSPRRHLFIFIISSSSMPVVRLGARGALSLHGRACATPTVSRHMETTFVIRSTHKARTRTNEPSKQPTSEETRGPAILNPSIPAFVCSLVPWSGQ